ncbi:MAG: creatininase family protein [Candidatus Woesearchaeota archaeon]|nr:MAG: creatininase family protein [Candidatus Woesearchaeota archaeon]
MKTENMSWDEIRDYRNKPIIIPIGAIEQHGPMAPVATDSIVAEYLANKLGEKLNFPVATCINFGCVDPSFRRFTGSICIKPETFINLLRDIIESYKFQGFSKFIIVNAHETNTKLIERVLQDIEGIKAVSFEYWKVDNRINDIVESELIHVCEDEIAIMLAIKPELIKKEKVVDELPKEAELEYTLIPLPEEYKTKTGVMGKPSKATAEKGRKIIDLVINKVLEIIRKELINNEV